MVQSGSTGTSVTIYQNTLRHIPENDDLHIHRGENPNSRKLVRHIYIYLCYETVVLFGCEKCEIPFKVLTCLLLKAASKFSRYFRLQSVKRYRYEAAASCRECFAAV
jgi:hypothetical protein